MHILTNCYIASHCVQPCLVILNEAKHKRFLVRGFHCETNTGPCIFSPFATSMSFFIFGLLFLTPFAANKRYAWPRPLHSHITRTSLRPGEEATETIWRAVNIVLMCRNTLNFFRFSSNIQTLFYWEWKG